ncbi:MAG: NADH-quinone oxidoreductase subunit N [Deltaproteobacteria bacterium]|nr:NADH-quinone oxidoreductase subunit N [Deltaproteobacteria bacterium]
MTDILAILPEIVIALSACLLLLLDIFVPEDKKGMVGRLAIAAILLAAFYSFQLSDLDITVMAGMYNIDGYSTFFKFVFYAATALSILLSLYHMKAEGAPSENMGEYYALMLFSLCGMMVMASGVDLLTIYLGLELMALPVYVLVGFLRKDARSNEAAMKYIILGAFSSGILLYGISLIYGITGTTSLDGIRFALLADGAHAGVFTLGVVTLACGFCFKVAGFPFHVWAPDAYEGAPMSVTVFMTVAAKAAAFAAITRVFMDALLPAYDEWKTVLVAVAVLSMIYGNITAIAQTNIKRMLAYSSVSHAGYALLGIIAGGRDGVAAVMFYMLVYTFMNLGLFGVIMMMGRKRGMGEDIREYTGLARTNRVAALCMLIFMFSLAGIPPTAGFMGKFYIFMALINKGMIGLAVVAVATTAIAAYFYIRIVMLMYMKDTETTEGLYVGRTVLYVTGISVVAVLLLGVYPGWFIDLAARAAEML